MLAMTAAYPMRSAIRQLLLAAVIAWPGPGRAVDEASAAAARALHTKHDITGRVVSVDPRTVYLEHMGVVVPVEIRPGTIFTGFGGKGGRLVKKGQFVMATVQVEGETTNVATTIAATTEAAVGASRGPQVSPNEPAPSPTPPASR